MALKRKKNENQSLLNELGWDVMPLSIVLLDTLIVVQPGSGLGDGEFWFSTHIPLPSLHSLSVFRSRKHSYLPGKNEPPVIICCGAMTCD